jgi:hypothetical protein
MARLEVLSPVAQQRGKTRFPRAPRPRQLSDKTIGLYDNGKPGGDVIQRRLIEQLSARFEGVRFRAFSGSAGGRATLTEEGAKGVAAQVDAVIGIRGD